MLFYLGTHHPHWLARLDVPLFVSRRALERLKTMPRARGAWALDSGGFSELTLHGRWMLSARDYVAMVRRYVAEIGSLAWAAPQDWMCEPDMLRRTGLSVEKHQRLTIANYLELRSLAPELPFVPVLQGWSTSGDYERHVDAYLDAGIDLFALPLVGIGTVCRRQHTAGVSALLGRLAHNGLQLHGFGFKMQGLRASYRDLASADSMAWSFNARRSPPLPGCIERHKNCANCPVFAMGWRESLLDAVGRQPGLWEAA